MKIFQATIVTITIVIISCTHVKIHDWYANGNSKYFDNFTASVVKDPEGYGYNISGYGLLNKDFVKGYVCNKDNNK